MCPAVTPVMCPCYRLLLLLCVHVTSCYSRCVSVLQTVTPVVCPCYRLLLLLCPRYRLLLLLCVSATDRYSCCVSVLQAVTPVMCPCYRLLLLLCTYVSVLQAVTPVVCPCYRLLLLFVSVLQVVTPVVCLCFRLLLLLRVPVSGCYPADDRATNPGLITSATIETSQKLDATVKLMIHHRSRTSPVCFTCDSQYRRRAHVHPYTRTYSTHTRRVTRDAYTQTLQVGNTYKRMPGPQCPATARCDSCPCC